jgi:hypothetical protein
MRASLLESFREMQLLHSCLLSMGMMRKLKTNLEQKGFWFCLCFCPYLRSYWSAWAEAKAGTHCRTWKSATEAETTNKCCLLVCFPCFLGYLSCKAPGPPAQAWHCRVSWALLHQLAIKKMLHRCDHRTIWRRQFLSEIPSSQVCLGLWRFDKN